MLSRQFVCGRSGVGKFLSILIGLLLIYSSTFCVKNFVLISAPGSGKGTFSQYLVKKHACLQICPGDLFRNEIALETELGKQIQPIVDKGEYVDEDIVCRLVEEQISKASDQDKGFILDGFPRSVISFSFLRSFLEKKGISNNVCFLQFVASDKTCTERILGRLVCTSCFRVYSSLVEEPQLQGICDDCGAELSQRKADTAAIAQKRLKYFHTHIEPLIERAKEYYPTRKVQSECSPDSLRLQYAKLFSE